MADQKANEIMVIGMECMCVWGVGMDSHIPSPMNWKLFHMQLRIEGKWHGT